MKSIPKHNAKLNSIQSITPVKPCKPVKESCFKSDYAHRLNETERKELFNHGYVSYCH